MQTPFPNDEERALLRDSVRSFLEQHWPAQEATAAGMDPVRASQLWGGLAGLGLSQLGTVPQEGGVREAVLVMEELGRAACAAPMLGAVLLNRLPAACLGPVGAAVREAMHRGEASVCFIPGDGIDPQTMTWHDDTLTGQASFAVDAVGATHALLVLDARRLGLVELTPACARVATSRAMGADGLLSSVVFEEAVGACLHVGPEVSGDVDLVARLLRMARAHGAARRAFEMSVDYATQRHQFGQPIGRFQAIQHKLADNLIALEGVRLTLDHAAASLDRDALAWRYFAQAALAFASPALRQASLQTHHAFGAIGYALEHEAARHFQRVHVDATAQGGVVRARHEVAAAILDHHDQAALPVYDLGPAGNAFRATVKSWLATHWQGERKTAFERQPFAHREYDAAFARDLGRTGWIGLAWPERFGGQARTPLEQLAFIEEMERAQAPRVGAAVQANALMLFGTPAQQAAYLPEILAGEAMHGMGYSEPEAGSDLASLRTRAVRDGDDWVITGQKIWTTTYWGKYMFLAARTDAGAKPAHAGISMFIVPMDAPGITVVPSTTLYDGSFANVFYDSVRVPADALLGELHGGWKVLTAALATERGLIGGGIVSKVVQGFERLCAQVRQTSPGGIPLARDPWVRDRLATLAAEIEVGRQLMAECARLAADDGVTPPSYGAISKVFSGELMERLGEATLDILGSSATLSQDAPGALANGAFEQELRHSLMWVISIGTNEIQRSLIAQRGLGLPR